MSRDGSQEIEGVVDLKVPVRPLHHLGLVDDGTFAAGVLDLVHGERCTDEVAADAYLLKPFKAKELLEKIDEMIHPPSGD